MGWSEGACWCFLYRIEFKLIFTLYFLGRVHDLKLDCCGELSVGD